jgi:hypothetical protein
LPFEFVCTLRQQRWKRQGTRATQSSCQTQQLATMDGMVAVDGDIRLPKSSVSHCISGLNASAARSCCHDAMIVAVLVAVEKLG